MLNTYRTLIMTSNLNIPLLALASTTAGVTMYLNTHVGLEYRQKAFLINEREHEREHEFWLWISSITVSILT